MGLSFGLFQSMGKLKLEHPCFVLKTGKLKLELHALKCIEDSFLNYFD